jgi:hypothetical protein
MKRVHTAFDVKHKKAVIVSYGVEDKNMKGDK